MAKFGRSNELGRDAGCGSEPGECVNGAEKITPLKSSFYAGKGGGVCLYTVCAAEERCSFIRNDEEELGVVVVRYINEN